MKTIEIWGSRAALAAALLCAATSSCRSAGPQGNAPPPNSVDSPRELAHRIHALVSRASKQKLDLLVGGPDTAVALEAGWERVRRARIVKARDGSVHPEKAALTRFIGLVEGRTRLPIPRTWETSVEGATWNRPGDIWFPMPEPVRNTRMRRDGDHWIVRDGSVSLTLPVDERHGPQDEVAVVDDGDTAYVLLYSWPSSPDHLYAVRRSKDAILWSSEVWADGDFLTYDGMGWNTMEMSLVGDELAVFGVTGLSAFIEVFNVGTGANEYRFSTAYLASWTE